RLLWLAAIHLAERFDVILRLHQIGPGGRLQAHKTGDVISERHAVVDERIPRPFFGLHLFDVSRNFVEGRTVEHDAITRRYVLLFEIAVARPGFGWHKQTVPQRPGNETAIVAVIGVACRVQAGDIALYDFAVAIQLPVEDIHVAVARRSPRTELDEVRLVGLA